MTISHPSRPMMRAALPLALVAMLSLAAIAIDARPASDEVNTRTSSWRPAEAAGRAVDDQATPGYGLTVDGTVRLGDESGPALAGVAIYASMSAGEHGPGGQVATTDAAGRFEVTLGYVPGHHHFAFWAAHSTTSFEPQQYAFTWPHSAGDSLHRTLDFVGKPVKANGGACPPPVYPRRILVDQGATSTQELSHTLRIRLGRDDEGPVPAVITVTTEAATVVTRGELSETDPVAVSFPLLPDAVAHPVVRAELEHMPGCAYHVSTAYDETGTRLAIYQGDQSPPTATPTPTSTPTPTPTVTGTTTPELTRVAYIPLAVGKRTPTPTPTSTPGDEPPDLVVQSAYITMEDTRCYYRQPLGTKLWVGNQGAAPTGPFVIRVNDESRVLLGGLEPGQSSSLWFSTSLSSADVALDTTNRVVESNEANNRRSVMMPVPTAPIECPSPTPAADPPDLSVVSMSIGMEDAGCNYGQPLGTWISFENRGGGGAGPFVVSVNRSLRAVGAGLAPGSSASVWFPGYRNLSDGESVGIVDSSNVVVEPSSDDNMLRTHLAVPTAPAPCPTSTRVPIP